MNDEGTTIAELKQMMVDFIAERNWEKYHRPKNLAMSIAIEAAELLEHFQWLDHVESEALIADNAARTEVAEEMCDVLSFLLSLAHVTGIDIASTYAAKMAKNRRKYPVDEVRDEYKKPPRAHGEGQGGR